MHTGAAGHLLRSRHIKKSRVFDDRCMAFRAGERLVKVCNHLAVCLRVFRDDARRRFARFDERRVRRYKDLKRERAFCLLFNKFAKFY